MTARAEGSPVPEQGPTEPKISITIAFSYHRTAEDARWVAPLLKEADVFIPEGLRWDEKYLKIHQRVSSGLLKPEQLAADPRIEGLDSFTLERLKMLFDSRKPVLFVDLPEGHPILQREAVPTPSRNGIAQVESPPARSLEPYEQFEDFLAALVRDFLAIGKVRKDREDYILSQLNPAISKLWKQHPRLRRQSELKVLLHIGSGHTLICSFLRRSGVGVVRKFDRLPVVFSYGLEILREAALNKEIDNDLAARAFLEMEDRQALSLNDITSDIQARKILRRLILSQFSFEDAREIFGGMKRGQSFKDLFAAKLREKGIVLPKTELELDVLLKSRGIRFRPSL